MAKWDGTSWTPLGDELVVGGVGVLVVFDDGTGPSIYAGGAFGATFSATIEGLARWDGAQWAAVGGGLGQTNGSASVRDLVVFDDGSGEALYVGGRFTSAGGVARRNVARWDGASWSNVGGGLRGPISGVEAFEVFDDGSGPSLYAGGSFRDEGSGPGLNNIARWNGASWRPLGQGLFDGQVRALEVFDDGTGDALYAGGRISIAGGAPADNIAKWDGSSWSTLGSGVDEPVAALFAYDDGSGAKLYVGGAFSQAGGQPANRVATWDGSSWAALGTGLNNEPADFAVLKNPSGVPQLHAMGGFSEAGGFSVGGMARWTPDGWFPFLTDEPDTAGLDREVWSLFTHDDGTGPALYVGGDFDYAGGVRASHIAKWDGLSWSALGDGVNNRVTAMATFDDGGGEDLYVAGYFGIAGGVLASRIARWDGTSWSTLGAGTNSFIDALEVYDDGTGEALYAAGSFTMAGGSPANYIAKWDGASWSPLGSGVDRDVYSLATFDDGSGARTLCGRLLLAGGGSARDANRALERVRMVTGEHGARRSR